MSRFIIKQCGLTRPQDAQLALEAGAQWLGLIFVPNTPRYLSLAAARPIVSAIREADPAAQVIGVFQNDRLETVRELYQALELDAVQLHGSESPEDCLALGLPFIKMLPLIRQLEAQTVLSYCQPPLLGLCRGLILERPKTDPWPEPAALPVFFPVPVLIAGGLTPDTVATVVQTYRPSGVDVSSGVESAPGVKDPELLRAFYTAARQAHPDFLTQLEATRPCNP